MVTQARAARDLARGDAACDEEAVSLSGSVEDLPLLEILQVVSFCQKTGHLTVRAPEGEAGVVFDSGRVVSGYAWDVPPLPNGAPPEGAARERVVRDRIASHPRAAGAAARGRVRLQPHPGGAADARRARPLGRDCSPYGINPEELMLDLARSSTRTGATPRPRSRPPS